MCSIVLGELDIIDDQQGTLRPYMHQQHTWTEVNCRHRESSKEVPEFVLTLA